MEFDQIGLPKIVGGLGGDGVEAERGDGVGFEVDDAVLDLELTRDAESRFEVDDETVGFKFRRRDDAVGDAGFVFEGDEDKPLGGAGALAADDTAGDGDFCAILDEGEIAGAPDIGEGGADMGHGVHAGGESHEGEVGLDAFAARHGGKKG